MSDTPGWVRDPDGGWHQAVQPVAVVQRKTKRPSWVAIVLLLMVMAALLVLGALLIGRMVDSVTPAPRSSTDTSLPAAGS